MSSQVLTLAEGRALLAQQKGGKNPQKPPATPRTPPQPYTDNPGAGEAGRTALTQEVTFPGKVPGLNGAGGLLRMHWSKRKALGGLHGWTVRAAQLAPMTGPVRLELIRYSTGPPMDYDNLVSTGKSILDALVRNGILPDDNPTIIQERAYTQTKVATAAEQRTVIRLTQLRRA